MRFYTQFVLNVFILKRDGCGFSVRTILLRCANCVDAIGIGVRVATGNVCTQLNLLCYNKLMPISREPDAPLSEEL